ncbi:unnamed protein product [Cylicocyclus nassatus]|uniref:WAP domain-containing protein n=1 Tax=Cylicocyclus nassatus TaxID=53992 RepID=A0AA36DR84_CYLNA|nr:unnamed protein product [Cylicocyclus nassatus]
MLLGGTLLMLICSEAAAFYKPSLPWKPIKNKSIGTNAPMPSSTHRGTIDWCSYWRAHGVERCIAQSRRWRRPARPLDAYKLSDNSLLKDLPTCQARFLLSTCVSSDICGTGKLCMDTTRVLCCQPPLNECSTKAQLGFKCVAKSPVSWCSTNDDCGGRTCCPTGCDYNICV